VHRANPNLAWSGETAHSDHVLIGNGVLLGEVGMFYCLGVGMCRIDFLF